MDKVILVYDGDAGLGAVLLDVLKKTVGREDCPLCEIIYSPVGKRREWKACERRLGISVHEVHRNTLPTAWGIAGADLPCILGRRGDQRPVVLLARAEILACRGRAAELERRLRAAIDRSPWQARA